MRSIVVVLSMLLINSASMYAAEAKDSLPSGRLTDEQRVLAFPEFKAKRLTAADKLYYEVEAERRAALLREKRNERLTLRPALQVMRYQPQGAGHLQQ